MSFSAKFRSNYARNLIRLAWTVEIIAVLIGLTISIVVSVSASQAYAEQGSSGFLGNSATILVAGLPFLLVAVVELCKIPLTFAFMAVQNIFWRLLFLFFVFFLCLITFETMLNGFERNFSNLSYAIEMRKNEIENVNAEIELLNRKKNRVQLFTSADLESELGDWQQRIDKEFNRQMVRIDKKTSELLGSIDDSFKAEIEQEIDLLIVKRDGYYEQWNEERQVLEDRFSSLLLNNLSDSREEKQRLLAELEGLKKEMQSKLQQASFLTREAVDRKYRRLIADKNKQLDMITTGYLGGDALTKQAAMEEQLRSQLTFINNKYQGRITEIQTRIDEKKQEIIDKQQGNTQLRSNLLSDAEKSKSRYAAIKFNQQKELNEYQQNKNAELELITSQVVDLDEQVFLLRNQQRNIQAEINRQINQNQVYRMAMYAFGKDSPVEVDRKMVGIVALIWFGSLALVASVTGVMLCLAGFYLKRQLLAEAEQQQEPPPVVSELPPAKAPRVPLDEGEFKNAG
jgi:hypothetical protein